MGAGYHDITKHKGICSFMKQCTKQTLAHINAIKHYNENINKANNHNKQKCCNNIHSGNNGDCVDICHDISIGMYALLYVMTLLESSEYSNAGYGSALTYNGNVETDVTIYATYM